MHQDTGSIIILPHEIIPNEKTVDPLSLNPLRYRSSEHLCPGQ
ncbi:hypothetical protein EMIT0P44_390024 [Pseudomonas sp. IT-P44]